MQHSSISVGLVLQMLQFPPAAQRNQVVNTNTLAVTEEAKI